MADEFPADEADAGGPGCFLLLPPDITVAVLSLLSPRDFASASITCRRLSEDSLTDAVWQRLVEQEYGVFTAPSAWLTAAQCLHGDEACLHASTAGDLDPAPITYRGLYRLLACTQPRIGYWRGVGDAPRGSLFKLSWGRDCCELHQLQCSDQNDVMRMSLLLRLGPSYPLHAADLVGETHLVIRQFRGEPRTPCAAAAAAAAVSTGGVMLPRMGRDGPSTARVLIREDVHPSHVLPASVVVGRAMAAATRGPPSATAAAGAGSSGLTGRVSGGSGTAAGGLGASSFGNEVLKFMASQVAPPRGVVRRRQRAEARSASSLPAITGDTSVSRHVEPVEVLAPMNNTSGLASTSFASTATPMTPDMVSYPRGTSPPDTAHQVPGLRQTSDPSLMAMDTTAGSTEGLSVPGQHAGGVSDVDAVMMDASGQASAVCLTSYRAGGLVVGGSPGGHTSALITPADRNLEMESVVGAVTAERQQSTSSISTVPEAARPAGTAGPSIAGSRGSSHAGSVELSFVSCSPSSVGRSRRRTPASPGGVVQPFQQGQQRLLPVGPAVQTHHFVRLQPSVPTRTHPMNGLWKGVYGPHGLEIISVSYDFSGSQARVTAWKVTGDHNVPAGQDTWWASAAPLALPWSEHELHLQEARLWLSDLAPAQPVWLGGPGGTGPGQALAGAGAGVGPGSNPPLENHPQLPRIVSCHVGAGRIAGLHYSNPQWVPGRLWCYEGGDLAFLYMWPGSEEEPMFMVDYTRVP